MSGSNATAGKRSTVRARVHLAAVCLGLFTSWACEGSDGAEAPGDSGLAEDASSDIDTQDAAGPAEVADASVVDPKNDAGPEPKDATTPVVMADAAVVDPSDAGVKPGERCNPNAMVPELCAPEGPNQSLNVELDVVYERFDDVMRFYLPGTNFGQDGEPDTVCPDIYMKPMPMTLRTYRGGLAGEAPLPASFPGPTLRLKIGDTLNLQFANLLSVTDGASENDGTGHNCAEGSPEADVSPNCFHGFNDTNIHFHGTHVAPDTNGQLQFLESGAPNPEFRLVDNVYVIATPPDAETSPPSPNCKGIACWKFPGDEVPPYALHFEESQIPGTHWYHAHKHGSTAIQMLNGLAGALIIEGDFAGIPEIEDANEQVLVLQQIDDRKPRLLEPQDSEEFQRQAPPELSVNGVITPTLTMKSGEVQRWRFISGTQQASASFKGMELQDVDGKPYVPPPGTECEDGVPQAGSYKRPGVYQIAQDGIEFLDERWQDVLCNNDKYLDIAFNSGNRADFLIVAPAVEERTELLLRKSDVIGGGGGNGGGNGRGADNGSGNTSSGDMPSCDSLPEDPGTFLANSPSGVDVPLLKLVIEPPDPMAPPPVDSLPRNLRTFDQLPEALQTALVPVSDEELTDPQTVEFQMNPGQAQSPEFYIDNKKFCADRLDQCMALGTAEEWTITNYTAVSHPFHIHINPFFITDWLDANTYFTGPSDPDNACFTECDESLQICSEECDGDFAEACLTGCTNEHMTCKGACPLPEDVGKLETSSPLRRWQDTIGLPLAYIPPLEGGDVCGPKSAEQDAGVQSSCGQVCAAANMIWNGSESCEQADAKKAGCKDPNVSCVCGCQARDACVEPLGSDADAERDCPAATEATDATWNGQWSCDDAAVEDSGCVVGSQCVCGRAPNPAPIREGFVKVRHRFLDYDGDFVIHCHILGHEDRGMMQRIGVRASLEECELAEDELWGEGCAAESVCAETCQSMNVDLSVPLPDMCQSSTIGKDGTSTWSRKCLEP